MARIRPIIHGCAVNIGDSRISIQLKNLLYFAHFIQNAKLVYIGPSTLSNKRPRPVFAGRMRCGVNAFLFNATLLVNSAE